MLLILIFLKWPQTGNSAPRVMTSDNLLILLDIQAHPGSTTRINFIKAGLLALIYLSSKALYFKQDLGGR